MSLDLSLKILIADDIDSARKVVLRLLHKIGFKDICEAKDGTEALKKLNESPIDLVIADLDMPGMTGLELLKEIRHTPELQHTLFILIASDAAKQHVMEAAKEKVSRFLLKPFTQLALEEAIENISRHLKNESTGDSRKD